MTDPTPYGFRVVGHASGTRRIVDADAAFAACAGCDPKAEPDKQSFLSIFRFPADLRNRFEATRSEAGYVGPCAASWLFWDIDRDGDLEAALREARRLAAFIVDRFVELDDGDLLIFLSGSKGFHVGLPATWRPEPTSSFHLIARKFCETVADAAGVKVDPSVYTKTRLLRAPNSRHAKTGLFKRRLTFDELLHLKLSAIVDLARRPEPFDVPIGPTDCPNLRADWNRAAEAVASRAVEQRRYVANGSKLARSTRDFIIDGAADGERELRTFKAAANLAEFGSLDALAFALLEEPALDSGLPPKEVRRAIEAGLRHGRQQRKGPANG